MPTSSGSPALERTPVRLSAAEKRDLVAQVVAALITTALIAAPLVVPREPDALLAAATPIGAAPVTPIAAGPVRASAVAAAVVVAPAPASPAAVLASAATSIKRRGKAVPAVFVVQAEPATPVAAASPVSDGKDAPRRPLARRFAGLLAGDGSHAVRPFPTLAAARH